MVSAYVVGPSESTESGGEIDILGGQATRGSGGTIIVRGGAAHGTASGDSGGNVDVSGGWASVGRGGSLLFSSGVSVEGNSGTIALSTASGGGLLKHAGADRGRCEAVVVPFGRDGHADTPQQIVACSLSWVCFVRATGQRRSPWYQWCHVIRGIIAP